MKALVRWIVTAVFGNGDAQFKELKIEGKETEAAKGRTRRLKSQRQVKDEVSRTGNKTSDDWESGETNWNQ